MDPTNPQTWNRYAYVGNNPLSNIDPSGLACYPLERAISGSCGPFMDNGVNFGGNWNEFSVMNIRTITPNATYIPPSYWMYTTTTYDSEGNQIGDPFYTFGVQTGGWQNLGSGLDVLNAANNGVRAPDFVSINVNVGIPYLLNLVGPTVAVNISRNGHVYIGPGINVGKAATLVSGSVTANWMTQPKPDSKFPDKELIFRRRWLLGKVCKARGRPAADLRVVQDSFPHRAGVPGHTPSTSGSGLEGGELMISRQAFIVSLLGAVFFLVVGLSGLFWPERIQTYALEHSTSRLHQKVNPFLGWMKTRQYIWSLRVIGVISIGAAVLLLVILVRHS